MKSSNGNLFEFKYNIEGQRVRKRFKNLSKIYTKMN